MNYELYHHGVVGMHWGVRRYQNADGSLKPAGRKRYTEGGKKQLTDEERAARNAKIKKAAIAVGAVAATAALAYVGHKYMNHVNSEADHNLGRAKAEAIIDAFDRSENAKNSNRDKYYAGDIDIATRFRKDIAASDRLRDTKRSIDRIVNDSDMKRKARNAVVREDLNYARDRTLRKKYKRSSYKDAAYGRTRAILDARTTVEERLRDRANEEAEKIKNRR